MARLRTYLAKAVAELARNFQVRLAATDGVREIFQRLEGVAEVAKGLCHARAVVELFGNLQVLFVVFQGLGGGLVWGWAVLLLHPFSGVVEVDEVTT